MDTVSLEEYLRVSDELETMRGVVEAVQALADEGARTNRHWKGYAIVTVNDLRAALAPVPSSGEALCDDPLCGSDPHKHHGDSTEYVPPSSGEAESGEALRSEKKVRRACRFCGRHVVDRAEWRYDRSHTACMIAAERGSTVLREPAPAASSDDHERGLHEKFRVERLTPSSRGTDHSACRYFVLDPQHDSHAVTALRTYADACEDEYPALAADLREWAGSAPVSSGGQADGDDDVPCLICGGLNGRHGVVHVRHGNGGHNEPCPYLAARPVLSREALRERLDGHWPFSDNYGVGCGCGWYDNGKRSLWRDHLADVLSGGEQA